MHKVFQIVIELQKESADKPIRSKQIYTRFAQKHVGIYVSDRTLRRDIKILADEDFIVPVGPRCARVYWLPENFEKHKERDIEELKREIAWEKKVAEGVAYFDNKKIDELKARILGLEMHEADLEWEKEKKKILKKLEERGS